ncbi:MAG: signal peptidase I [Patescibacteria group bacterium]
MKKKKIVLLSILGLGFQLLLVVFLLGLSVISFGGRIPFLANRGLNFFAVSSGSMEPTIPAGSLIYAGRFEVDQLKKGDIITFRVKNPDNGTVSVVTHRIDKVIKEEAVAELEDDGQTNQKKILNYQFVTKGDTNNDVDFRTVPAGNIIGLYHRHWLWLGRLVLFVQSGKGFLLMVVLPALTLIGWELVSVFSQINKYYRQKTNKEIERLKKELKKSRGEKKT